MIRLGRWGVLLGTLVVVALLLVPARVAEAQRGNRGGFQQMLGSADDFFSPPDFKGNPKYDGRFIFARIKYRGYEHWSGREGPGWSHDYPDADEHLSLILKEVTNIRPHVPSKAFTGGVIVALDDPELFKYPISYLSEPGGWFPNEKEVRGMRNYLLKGGFVIFDDFRGQYDWNNLLLQMRRVMPELRPVQLTGKEPIFDSFFKVDMNLASRQAAGGRGGFGSLPQWWGWYDSGDPKKRLIAVGALNGDIGEFWQWSGTGFASVEASNEAYKIGVNYIVYALTH